MEATPKPNTNRVFVAVLMFIAIGFIFNLGLNYINSSSVEATDAARLEVANEVLKLAQKQTEQNEEILRLLKEQTETLKYLQNKK